MIRLSAVPHKEARTTIGLEGTPFLIFLIYSNCSPCSRCCLLPLVLLFLFPGSRLVKFSCFGKSQAKWFTHSIMGEERTELKKKKKADLGAVCICNVCQFLFSLSLIIKFSLCFFVHRCST